MPSKKQRAKARAKAKFSTDPVESERYDPQSDRSKEIMNVCRANIWVQKQLGRPFSKINMLLIKDEGVDWLYGEQTEEGFGMFETKIRGLEVEYPNVCQNWWMMFLFQMKMSSKYNVERGIDDDARFFFCCCLKEGGEEVRGFKMEHGDYFTFYDTQENPIV